MRQAPTRPAAAMVLRRLPQAPQTIQPAAPTTKTAGKVSRETSHQRREVGEQDLDVLWDRIGGHLLGDVVGARVELRQRRVPGSRLEDRLASDIHERLGCIRVHESSGDRDPVLVAEALFHFLKGQASRSGYRWGPHEIALDVAAAPAA